MVQTRRFKLLEHAPLSIQEWEAGQTIVYHHGVGHTHLLNSVAAVGLGILQKGEAWNIEDFSQTVSRKLDVADDQDLRLLLDMLLDFFDRADLIEWVQ